jgi:hypothetical protein
MGNDLLMQIKINNINKEQTLAWIGLLIVIIATAIELFRGRASNYYVYSDATIAFWNGITPYTHQFVSDHGRYFLYTPVFTTLFAPIFLLPKWLGPFIWNGMNYGMMLFAINSLPGPLKPYRNKIFAFLLLLIVQGTFCFQFNVVVCYLFLFAFTLLERNHPLWAIVLIAISATTKIYGGIELGLLLCYPKIWRNIGFAICSCVILLLLPLINTSFEHPLELYGQMATILDEHTDTGLWAGLLYTPGLRGILLSNIRLVQVGVLLVLAILFFCKKERWSNFKFRVQVLAIMMGYIILFSDSPEIHTYLITLSGYQMAFWLQPQHSKFDWILFWLLFVNFCILPVDVLCPTSIYNFFHSILWLDIYIMTIAWIRVIWWAVKPNRIPFPIIHKDDSKPI